MMKIKSLKFLHTNNNNQQRKNTGHDGSVILCNGDSYVNNVVLNANNCMIFISTINEDYEIIAQVKLYFKNDISILLSE